MATKKNSKIIDQYWKKISKINTAFNKIKYRLKIVKYIYIVKINSTNFYRPIINTKSIGTRILKEVVIVQNGL